jgi:exosortase/archaeosortase family protein
VIYLGKGRTGLRQLAFPICFFLVAIPWPTLVETPIIQTLTRISATVVTELLGWVGVPAVTHGNVIEVSTGLVGVDEACSGIRSFQSSLMISLFFGEFYRLNQPRRWLLVPLGFIFSMAFNVCRMSLLTLVAAKKGIAAISEYHDPAGFSITIICTLVLWGLAVLFKRSEAEGRRQKAEDGSQKAEGGDGKGQRENSTFVVQSSKSEIQTPVSRVQPAPLKLKSSTLGRLGASLLVWLVVVEGGVQVWYHTRESQLKPGLEWTLNFPGNNPTMKDLPIDSKTRYLLRFDEGKQAVWSEPDGTHWQAYYFNWFPGRVAGYLAKRHTPEICLASEGLRLISGPELNMMNIHGVELPIRCYQFQNEEGVIQVFHCRWEAGAGKDDYVAHDSARYNLIRTIWTGRGNQGQKVLEFIILGEDDPKRAKQALEQELSKLIVVKS